MPEFAGYAAKRRTVQEGPVGQPGKGSQTFLSPGFQQGIREGTQPVHFERLGKALAGAPLQSQLSTAMVSVAGHYDDLDAGNSRQDLA